MAIWGCGCGKKIFIKWLFQMFNLQQMHLTLICLAWLSLREAPSHRAGLPRQRKWGLLKHSSVCDSIQKDDLGRGPPGMGGKGRGGPEEAQGWEEEERSPPPRPPWLPRLTHILIFILWTLCVQSSLAE